MPTIRTNISTFFDTSATITSVTPTGQWVITLANQLNLQRQMRLPSRATTTPRSQSNLTRDVRAAVMWPTTS
jgi:hypothetical protein